MTNTSLMLRETIAKRKLLGCLTHAPAREAVFDLHSGPAADFFAFVSRQVSPVTWDLIGHHNKRYTAILDIMIHGSLSCRLFRLVNFLGTLSSRFLTIRNYYIL